jgi:catechol-2,3-dioxygenase
MHVLELGHVVLKVRDVREAEAFYGETLGLPVAGRTADPVPMVFFSLVRQHDFAVIELGGHGRSADRYAAGLAHVAFKVGNSIEEFEAVKREVRAAGLVVLFELDHVESKGMHLHDPDGNEVELFVDLPRVADTES